MINENKPTFERDPKNNIDAEKFKIADLLYKKKEELIINGNNEGLEFSPAEKDEKTFSNSIDKEKQNATMEKLNQLLQESSERAPPLEIEESKIMK